MRLFRPPRPMILFFLLLAAIIHAQNDTSGWKPVAEDSGNQHTGFIQSSEVWRLGAPLTAVSLNDPARNMFFGPAVTAGFSGLEKAVTYELEMTFLSDCVGRKVHVTANGRDLEKSLSLPEKEVLHKRWLLPPEIFDDDGELVVEARSLSGPNAVVSNIAMRANKPEAKPLVLIPERIKAKMVAWETASQNSLNSFVQCTGVWKMNGTGNQATADAPLRSMFFGGTEIKIVFTGAEPSTAYGVELMFLSDDDKRSVRISAGGIVLKDSLALPKGQIKRKYFPIPPEAIKDGRIEIAIGKVSGPNVVLSGVAVFADNAKAKALVALPTPPLAAELIPFIRLTPRPSEVAGVKTLKLDLNGTWKFNPAPPPEFWTAAASGGDWKDIQVPGEWTMQGFKVEPNIAAGYRREFSVPEDWNGQRVKLRCDAVYSDAKVWINGREAGAHLGGFTPFELDVTSLLKPGEKNTITLAVKNESLADSLAKGSQYAVHPLGGIPRKIYLFAVPEVNVADLYIRTEFDHDFANAALIAQVKIANDSTRDSTPTKFTLNLRNPEGAESAGPLTVDVPAIKAGQSFSTELQMSVPSPQKWDAEHPNLYTVAASLQGGSETVNKRIGFRQVGVRGNQLFVNNVPVKLRGVCRHETHPLLGRATTPEMCREDVELFRAMNVNFIRTSHYPPQEEFLEACNELGMFVELEAPVVWVNDALAKDASLLPLILQTQVETTLRDRSEPSVIMWSLGNESHWGRNFEASMAVARKLDDSRPILFDSGGPFLWGNENAGRPQPLVDIDAPHYPGLSGFEKRFDGNPKPTLLGEYAHLNCYNRRQFMTDPGLRDFWGLGIAEMWEHMLATQSCLGGNVWAAIDDFFFLPSGDTVGYGNWGPLDGWRRTKPEYWHLKKIYSPVRIAVDALPSPAAGKPLGIPVENRHFFSNLNELRFDWTFDNQSGTLADISVAPGAKGELPVPVASRNPDGKTLELKAFNPQGVLVDAWRFTIGTAKPTTAPAAKTAKVRLTKTSGALVVECGDTRWELSATTGMIQQATDGGQPVAVGGPTLMLLPLVKDSEGKGCLQLLPGKTEFPPVKTACGDWKASKVEARETANGVEVEIAGEYAEAQGRFVLKFTGDGRLTVDYDFKLKAPLDSWQLGVVFDMPLRCDTLAWKRKAQWSYYPDDHIGRAEGTAKASNGKPKVNVPGPHTRPDGSWSLDETEMGSNDFCSMKRNIIEASLRAPDGSGLRVIGNGPQNTRCWLDGDRIRLLVADYANAGLGLCMNEYVVPFRPLRAGDAVEGKVILEPLLPIKN